MTGTEPHAPRGTAGRGPNWDRGPGAGRAGAARRWTTWHRRPWAQPGPLAMDGPRRLRVYACPPWHRRPRDPQGDRGLRAGRRSCVTRSGHNGCRRDASDRLLLISCTGGHGNDHVAIILFTSRHLSLRRMTLVYPKLPLSAGPRVLKQTARKLVSPVTTQSCVSLVDKVSSVDSQRSSRNSLH